MTIAVDLGRKATKKKNKKKTEDHVRTSLEKQLDLMGPIAS